MQQNAHFAELFNVCGGFSPVNMATAANTGDWVNMANYAACTVLFFKAAGTAGEPPTITLLQGTSNAGANSKALNFGRVWYKRGAALSAIGQWTAVDQTPTNTYLVGTAGAAGDHEAIVSITVRADDLDANASTPFQWVNAAVADVGSGAQLGCLLYLLHGARYGGGAVMPSPL